jgi:hypothetical protein
MPRSSSTITGSDPNPDVAVKPPVEKRSDPLQICSVPKAEWRFSNSFFGEKTHQADQHDESTP